MMPALDRFDQLAMGFPLQIQEQIRSLLRMAYVQGLTDALEEMKEGPNRVLRMAERAMPTRPQ